LLPASEKEAQRPLHQSARGAVTSHAATDKGLATAAIQMICIENQKKLLNLSVERPA
jgi:hypothetical protein